MKAIRKTYAMYSFVEGNVYDVHTISRGNKTSYLVIDDNGEEQNYNSKLFYEHFQPITDEVFTDSDELFRQKLLGGD